MIVKVILGLYVKKKGETVNSESLINSGTDALMDSLISFSTFVAALIFIKFNISLEAYIGVIISIIIIKSGIEMLKSTISKILGERVDKDFAINIKKIIGRHKEVKGTYDLILNNYGPTTYMGSIHIEIPDTMNAVEIDKLTRDIADDVYKETNVMMTAIGIYSLNTKDKEIKEMRKKIGEIISSYKTILQMHGFYVNKDDKVINFDIIFDFKEDKKEEIYKEIVNKINKLYKDYKVNITMDIDISD